MICQDSWMDWYAVQGQKKAASICADPQGKALPSFLQFSAFAIFHVLTRCCLMHTLCGAWGFDHKCTAVYLLALVALGNRLALVALGNRVHWLPAIHNFSWVLCATFRVTGGQLNQALDTENQRKPLCPFISWVAAQGCPGLWLETYDLLFKGIFESLHVHVCVLQLLYFGWTFICCTLYMVWLTLHVIWL